MGLLPRYILVVNLLTPSGDEYVDVIGMDVYEPGLVSYFSTAQLISVLSEMTTYATAHGKVAALTETGSRDGNVSSTSVPLIFGSPSKAFLHFGRPRFSTQSPEILTRGRSPGF